MRRCTVKDKDMINSILKHDDVWPYVIDDSIKDKDLVDFSDMLSNPNVYILSPNKSTMFMFVPVNMITFDAHVSSTPDFRGKLVIEAYKKGIRWIFNNTLCRKLVANIPSYNKKAIIFAILCGFKREGVNMKSFIKDNILYDQVMLGLSKEVS